ncbi:TPA: helix-turn-helix domain-containing protein [Vibrio parahaemolyticus]
MTTQPLVFNHNKPLVVFLGNAVADLTCTKLERTCLAVAQSLAKYWNPRTNEAYPSQATIAAEVGVSTRTVQRAIAHLEEAKVLIVQRAKKQANHIGFNFNALQIFIKAAFKKHNAVCKKGHRHSKYKNAIKSTPETFKEFLKSCKEWCEEKAIKAAEKRGAEIVRKAMEKAKQKKKSSSKPSHYSSFGNPNQSKEAIAAANKKAIERQKAEKKAADEYYKQLAENKTSKEQSLSRIAELKAAFKR